MTMHDHGHDHSHLIEHSDVRVRGRLILVMCFTLVVVAAQITGSILTGSLALLTDTAHALADASGLVVAVVAASLVLLPTNKHRTWGFKRVEVIAALAQATLLLVVGGFAVIEGAQRIIAPPAIASGELLIFGIVGLAANVGSLIVLTPSRGANLNMRAAFLEVLNDALGSLSVIVAALVIRLTGFQRADAIAGLFIALLILPRAYRLARKSLGILLEFTPVEVDLDELRNHILALEHVCEVHDLHTSTLGTGLTALTAHVVLRDECFTTGCAPKTLQQIDECVQQHFPLAAQHITIQLETEQHHATETMQH